MPRIDTLVLVRDLEQRKVLLGMKKRGFGAGNWNGFGGKVLLGEEEIAEAARRELLEEAGITVETLREAGTLHFSFEHDASLKIECRIFEGLGITGIPIESEEMRPEWFMEDALPYDAMWADDRHWIPLLLKGESFTGSFHFAENGIILHGMLNERVF